MSNKIQLPPISNLLKQQDFLEPQMSIPVPGATTASYVDASTVLSDPSKSPQNDGKLAPLLQPMLPTFIQPPVTSAATGAPSNFPVPQQLPPPTIPAQVYAGQQFAPPSLYALPTPANSSPSNTPPLNATNLYYYLYPSYVYTYQNGQPVVAALAPGTIPLAYATVGATTAPLADGKSTAVGAGAVGSTATKAASLGGAPQASTVSPVASQVGSAAVGENSVSPGAKSPSTLPPRERKASMGHMSLDKTRKTRSNLPKETTFILLKWLNEHLNHPYPNSFEKNQLMLSTGLNQQQLSNWFINARRRKIRVLKEQTRISSV